MPVSLYTVAAVIVMDLDGNRLLAKYYEPSSTLATSKSQRTFERTLFTRTTGSNLSSTPILAIPSYGLIIAGYFEDEVAMLNGYVAVYRANLDLIVYVIGSAGQNELMLTCVLDTFFDVLTELLK